MIFNTSSGYTLAVPMTVLMQPVSTETPTPPVGLVPKKIIKMYISERYPNYGAVNVPIGGTFQITVQPTWSLRANNGTLLVSGQNVTGYDAGVQSVIATAWVNFSPLDWGLAPGIYWLRYAITGVGSDGLERIHYPTIQIIVASDGVTTISPIRIRPNEMFPIYGSVVIPPGVTFTISNAVWGLYDVTRRSSLLDQPITGYDVGAMSALARSWIEFTPSAFSLAIGSYTLFMLVSGNSSDTMSLNRVYEPCINIEVIADNT